eukprot:TRINITY_DN49383_c0_g1_i1.p1 TRINITY_DN49383_c0_g1~~TRINITY_DN49383_c0_g1_i1.p1  ORF type:complete len:574 (-),score=71.37 TRINITY_DN49383_c0_g1_i1:111-1832(-)
MIHIPFWARCLLVSILTFFALWNFSKLPFYWENEPMTNVTYDHKVCDVPKESRPKPCVGMVAQYNLFRAFGKESGHKIRADKDLFLIPHTAMGVSLEGLLIYALLEGNVGLYERSKFFLPLALIFGLHVLPAAKGIPDSLAGAPINEILSVLIVGAAIMGFVGMRQDFLRNGREPPINQEAGKLIVYSWTAIGSLINLAPIGEFLLPSKAIEEPDVPHPESGHSFYTSLNCPWLGRIAAMYCLFTVFMYAFDSYARMRNEQWRSPFSRDGPALYQIAMNPYPDTGKEFLQRSELWLAATGECFVLCIFSSWVVTSLFNPGIFRDNILRTLVGYNNLCVGFDSAPARYIAMPLLVLQAVLANRYAYLDTIRLNAERGTITECQYMFGKIANSVFALWMLCFPMLLVILADFNSWASTKIHLYLFMATLFIMWMMIAGNIYEADELTVGTKIWFALFTAHTLALPVVGIIDILNFHPDLDSSLIYTIRYERPHPAVPWPVTAYLDYGWFIMLLLTVLFLPDSCPIHTRMDCDLDETHASKLGRPSEENLDLLSGEKVEWEEESSDSDEAKGGMCA